MRKEAAEDFVEHMEGQQNSGDGLREKKVAAGSAHAVYFCGQPEGAHAEFWYGWLPSASYLVREGCGSVEGIAVKMQRQYRLL